MSLITFAAERGYTSPTSNPMDYFTCIAWGGLTGSSTYAGLPFDTQLVIYHADQNEGNQLAGSIGAAVN